MPLIEELPTTGPVRASHGWAYVADTGPAKAIHGPGNRKRGAARETGASKGDGSVKQAKIVQSRLADLEKENYKDTVIPIPPRPKDKNKKITPNVRRILTYQRTFAHYLADEEAQLAQSGSISTPTVSSALSRVPQQQPPRNTAKAAAGSGSAPSQPRSRAQMTMHPPPLPPAPRTAGIKREASSSDIGVTATVSSSSQTNRTTVSDTVSSSLPTHPSLDSDPLLMSQTPKFPSARVMAALLAEAPLSYSAARAQPLEHDNRPARHFCATCGYWGKVKCRRCGERTCGLMECWKGHEVGCSPY